VKLPEPAFPLVVSCPASSRLSFEMSSRRRGCCAAVPVAGVEPEGDAASRRHMVHCLTSVIAVEEFAEDDVPSSLVIVPVLTRRPLATVALG